MEGLNLRRWLPAAAAVAVLALVVGIGLAGRSDRSDAASDGSAEVTSTSLAVDPAATSTTVPVVVEQTDPAVPKTHLDRRRSRRALRRPRSPWSSSG